ncbi:hypothetical protein [Polynucleobacter sp. JS-JIR-II-50]|uniref:hypothetical protein n=1 Tax=Polynucleobacter sp. JS-JIR-II-50 TaxID=2576919 RepID=UPI001BFE6883|nr:hypothetical protein [Polynucleobacter sp. JS-JIR-II-50]QWE05353.1 hypothetical protein FD963_04800 [Polynucleobacter sp. JS-JIR-II-50]
MSKDKELAIAYVSSKGRICPNPQEWMALSEIIGMNGPGRKLVPLILAGWAFTSDAQKRARVIEQIEYVFSSKPELSEAFCKMLYSFSESQWYAGAEPPSTSAWDGT